MRNTLNGFVWRFCGTGTLDKSAAVKWEHFDSSSLFVFVFLVNFLPFDRREKFVGSVYHDQQQQKHYTNADIYTIFTAAAICE